MSWYHDPHKLNLIGPAPWICLAIAVLFGIGLILHALGCALAGNIAYGLASLVTLVFFILIVVEQKQDRRQYEQARKDDPDVP